MNNGDTRLNDYLPKYNNCILKGLYEANIIKSAERALLM